MLSYNREQLLEILSSSIDGFIELNSEFKIVNTNKQFCQMLAYKKEQIIGNFIENFEAQKILMLLENSIVKNIKIGLKKFDSILKTKLGGVIYVEISTKKLDNNSYICFLRDISIQKVYEMEIQNALNFNKKIFENAPFGIAVYRSDGQAIMTNQKAVDIVGAPNKEALLKQNYKTIPSWIKSGLKNSADEAFKTNKRTNKLINILTSFNELVWLDCSFIPIKIRTEIHILLIINDISDIKNYEIKLKNLAEKDYLTKIYNRSKGNELFDNLIENCLKNDLPLSAIIFDIDHFKNINDSYGHNVGDKVLIEISKTVKKFIKNDQLFIRWGGEEFLIVLPKYSLRKAVKFSEMVRVAISSKKIDSFYTVTASFGVGQIHNIENKKDFINRIDSCLYQAKNKGRDCVVSCDTV